jgi:hypothetical protein
MDRMREHEALVDSVLVALSATGICRVWKQPTGAAYRNGRMVRYGTLGSADISGILVGGTRLEIEVKTGNAQQRKSQKAFGKMILEMGGVYLVARNVQETVELVKKVAALVTSLPPSREFV